MVGGQSQLLRAQVLHTMRVQVMARWRTKERWRRGKPTLSERRSITSRVGYPQQVEWASLWEMDAMQGGLRGAICTHSRRSSHTGRERTSALTLKVDAKAMSILGMLQQKPGTAEWLLTGCARVAAGLIFTCKTHKRRVNSPILTATHLKEQ